MTPQDLKISRSGNVTFDLFNKSPLRFVTRARLLRSVMQDDYLDLTVESAESIDFFLEDKIIVDGNDYFLNLTPTSRKNSSRNFVYNLRFESAAYLLRKTQVFNRDSQNRKTDFQFNLAGDLNDFIQLILTNANNYDEKWVAGTIPQDTEIKNIYFNKQNTLSALHDICDTYGVEFWVETVGSNYEINIGQIGHELSYVFEYGRGQGLYTLERKPVDDREVVTRLYAFGSSDNLPLNYRENSSRLRMPDKDYIEDQVMINTFGFVEGIHESDVKPELNLPVTSVGALSTNYLEFYANGMPFDLAEEDQNEDTKYLLDGEPAIIHFLTGRLAGYEFNVYSYDHGLKRFMIERYTDERGSTFPDAVAFALSSGDLFTITNIMMPQSYVDDAEQRLKEEAENEYEKLKKTNIKYVLNVDPLFMRDKAVELGDSVTVKDLDFGVNDLIRIMKYEYDILNDKYNFDLSDIPEISLTKRIATEYHVDKKEIRKDLDKAAVGDLKNYVRIKDLESTILDEEGLLRPTIIKRESITREMMVKNARPQQMGVDGIILDATSDNVAITSGSLTNFAVEGEFARTWNMNAGGASNLDENKSYFVYAKVDKNSNSGDWVVTDDEIQVDEDDDFYHFLTAVLYQPEGGRRNMDLIHGAKREASNVYQQADGAGFEVVPIVSLNGMSNQELGAKVQVFRNGVLMRWGGFGMTGVHINGDGNIEPDIEFQVNDKVDIIYSL